MDEIGAIVITKKKHPCGGNRWEIVRVGADYKLKCLTCGRVVMLDAQAYKKAVKEKLSDERSK